MSEYLKSHWKDPKLASLITQKVCFLTLQLNHALLLTSLRRSLTGPGRSLFLRLYLRYERWSELESHRC
jgi:hypothetical protein